MAHTPEFQALLRAIAKETGHHPDPVITRDNGIISVYRKVGGHAFDCYFHGENIVPFKWTDGEGVAHVDFRLGDITLATLNERGRHTLGLTTTYVATMSGLVVTLGTNLDTEGAITNLDTVASPDKVKFLVDLLSKPEHSAN